LRFLGAAAKDVGQHVLEVHVHVLKVLVADDAELGLVALAHIELDLRSSSLPRGTAGGAFRGNADSCRLPGSVSWPRPARAAWAAEEAAGCRAALLGVHFGLVFDFFKALFADHVDGDLDEVADHGFHVAADVADFGKLGGFHLEERRVGELGEAARDFGFAHAGGPNHDDVLGHDVFGEIGRELLAALAVAQSDGHGALGGLWPTTCLSSSATISRGVSSSSASSCSSADAGR
jgi:hypothetical protein